MTLAQEGTRRVAFPYANLSQRVHIQLSYVPDKENGNKKLPNKLKQCSAKDDDAPPFGPAKCLSKCK